MEGFRTERQPLHRIRKPPKPERAMTAKILTAVPITARLSPISDALTTLARRVWNLPAALAHRDQLRRLAERDDHVLADIGFTRADIDAALSAPFWRDPSDELVRRGGPKADRRGRTSGENGRSVVTSPELILAACNRRLPAAPLYFAGR
jgi:uncharacterized protein YjiS (DUF1127 family)